MKSKTKLCQISLQVAMAQFVVGAQNVCIDITWRRIEPSDRLELGILSHSSGYH